MALDLILRHISFHYTTVANSNLPANLAPFVAAPVSWPLFGERIAAVFYGLYLITVGRLRERYNAGDILFWGGFSSLAVLMQPVIAAFYAFLIFSETLSALEVAGAGVVLAGIYIAKIGASPSAAAKR